MSNAAPQILQALTRHGGAIRAFGARRLGLFGSQAQWEATEISDLTSSWSSGRVPRPSTTMDLKAFLEDLFGRPVDLVISEVIKPRLRVAILRETIYAPGL